MGKLFSVVQYRTSSRWFLVSTFFRWGLASTMDGAMGSHCSCYLSRGNWGLSGGVLADSWTFRFTHARCRGTGLEREPNRGGAEGREQGLNLPLLLTLFDGISNSEVHCGHRNIFRIYGSVGRLLR